MLTNVVKATRARYAALQHKPGPDRVAIDYEVSGHTAGTVWVKAATEPRRKSELTKLNNRLRSMFPEAAMIHCAYRTERFKVEVLADSSGVWAGNALTFGTRPEAEAYARDLFSRWTAVREWRVVSA